MSVELEAMKCLNFLKNESINEIACLKNSVTTKTLYQLYFANFDTIEQALIKAQQNETYKFYKVMIRQYSIMKNDNVCYVKFIKTNDIYHWIGKYYSSALEKVERIDYQEISEETFRNEKPRTYYKGELI